MWQCDAKIAKLIAQNSYFVQYVDAKILDCGRLYFNGFDEFVRIMSLYFLKSRESYVNHNIKN